MESSRFIQIAEDILIEYVYTNQADPTVFNTSNTPIEILKNEHTSGINFFNSISALLPTGINRNNSAIPINKNKTEYVSLNALVGVPYNDVDSKLTSSSDLLQEFSPNLNVEYDRVKVHFSSGFSFQDYDGIIFEIKTSDRNGNNITLSSLNFLRTDTPTFNPNPLLIADRLYSTFVEWSVPSLFYINARFSTDGQNGLGFRLTSGSGFKTTPVLSISASGILNTTSVNGYDFYQVNEINSTTITSRDIYDNLFASVVESREGDFFELKGNVIGSTFSNFVNQLNLAGGNYVVFHEITLTEQIGTSFIQTNNQIMTQTSDFDTPVLYRPIVLNTANAVSFSINYTLRLFNRVDNTQIIKNARLSLFDVNKYGKRIMKINLGKVPTVATVVNQISDNGSKIVISTGNGTKTQSGKTSDNIVSQLSVKTRYVTSFRDRINIKAAISPVKIQNITE